MLLTFKDIPAEWGWELNEKRMSERLWFIDCWKPKTRYCIDNLRGNFTVEYFQPDSAEGWFVCAIYDTFEKAQHWLVLEILLGGPCKEKIDADYKRPTSRMVIKQSMA